VLPRKTKTDLLEDIRRFVSNKKWYDDLGIPYRRGYLFYGPPGSGKSSLATALAGEIQRDLYVLSLATRGLDDQGLMQLMSRVPSNGVLLIEDIDAAFAERDKSDTTSSQVTFSGLLNAFDGVGSRDGQIVIMSTNHIEKLDPALIRPGRVDWQAFLGNAVPEQVAELFLRFFPESGRANEFVEKVAQSEISMAALQNHFIQYTDEDDAVSHAVAA
jgi:chaperone BCS1